jgi:hypothetical protein
LLNLELDQDTDQGGAPSQPPKPLPAVQTVEEIPRKIIAKCPQSSLRESSQSVMGYRNEKCLVVKQVQWFPVPAVSDPTATFWRLAASVTRQTICSGLEDSAY